MQWTICNRVVLSVSRQYPMGCAIDFNIQKTDKESAFTKLLFQPSAIDGD